MLRGSKDLLWLSAKLFLDIFLEQDQNGDQHQIENRSGCITLDYLRAERGVVINLFCNLVDYNDG